MQVLVHGSRQLDDEASLAQSGVVSGATLSVSSRLRGGGGDGGSTGAESRSCYLEMYAERKPDKVNPAEELLARATRCRLSGEKLTPPCVADELGSMFNKEALVHALLNKTMPPVLGHITSLKSVINLKLDPLPRTASNGLAGPALSSNMNGHSNDSGSSSVMFQCPVTGLEMTGKSQFVVHRPTGVVVSERAVKDVPLAVEELLGGKWTADDFIPINPQANELEKRQQQVHTALAADKAKKKAKKADKVKAAAAADLNGAAAAANGSTSADGLANHRLGSVTEQVGVGSKRALPPAGNSVLPNGMAAATAAKKVKVPAGATPEVYASIFSSSQPRIKETFCCRALSGRAMKS
eukprot:GHRR01033340.1.p1 GENE.GHRR01033340.1~~GHRR01033340.1.p1  ORF type:complete len:353 (+),score=135.82 GHRR01033340.1:189-1247(+)